MKLKPESIRPVEIQTAEDKGLCIEWQDSHRSLYTFPYLRRKCRCAACVDEWTGREKLLPEKISETIRILETLPVGNYGIRFQWSDGHSTGIYAFEYLRSICPCEECRDKNK